MYASGFAARTCIESGVICSISARSAREVERGADCALLRWPRAGATNQRCMRKVTITTADGFELLATAFGDPQRVRVGRLIVAAQGLVSLSSRFRLPATGTCRGAML
jgi:hypothetical protein